METKDKPKNKNRLATKWLFTKNRSCSCTMPGVWRAVSFCEGCAVIFHSPLGCAHVATLMDLGAQYRIIGNSRNTPGEKELLEAFARKLNSRLVAFVPRGQIVNVAENQRQTVLQFAPESRQAEIYIKLAETIWNNTELSVPTPMEFEELEELAARFGKEA